MFVREFQPKDRGLDLVNNRTSELGKKNLSTQLNPTQHNSDHVHPESKITLITFIFEQH